MASCGEVLIELLESYGIDTVFGIPGVHTVEMYRGLSSSNIRHVTPRHEQGAGFMADGYHRASGKIAACLIITGPGMTNIATAMGQALADSIPMLVISSVNETQRLGLGEGRLHELPSQHNLVSGVARFSHTLMRADELPQVLARAFSVFKCQRPGPVHIEIPIDVITAPADHVPRVAMRLPSRPAAPQAIIIEAVGLLAESKNTVVVAGGGAINASSEITAVAEKLNSPVINTVNAKGVISIDHALAVGGSASSPAVRQLLETADLVLAVGTEFGETDYDFFYHGDVSLQGKLIRIDIDAQQLTRSVVANIAICGDAQTTLQDLLLQLGSQTPGTQNGAARVADVKRQLVATRDPGYEQVFSALAETLPMATIAGDSAQPTYYAWLHYDCTRPRAYFHSASGFGTLGYAIPAAIGAKLAVPDVPVIGLIGDGASLFTIGELASAVELQLAVIFVVWNNHGYGEIKRSMKGRDIEPLGVDIATPDFVKLAAAFGCAASRPTSIDAFRQVLVEAAQHQGPTLIELQQNDFADGFAQV